MQCPRCSTRLSHVKEPRKNFWICSTCNGRAVNIALLRHTIDTQTVNQIWQKAMANLGSSTSLPCPSCRRVMCEVTSEVAPQEVDACLSCQIVWFDMGEMESLPERVVTELKLEDKSLSPEIRKQLAIAEIQQISRLTENSDGAIASWQWLFVIFGFPVETRPPTVSNAPIATWVLTAATVAVSLLFMHAWPESNALAFIPAEKGRYGGLTFLSTFFVHGGLFHLIGNMYFLLVFGDNVEDYLGKARFLFLIAAATACGAGLHAIGDPRSDLPLVGASGGIAGILLFYSLQFPMARLGSLILFRLVQYPAWAGFILWVFFQGLGVVKQLHGTSHISALGHIGGALTGFAAWVFWRQGSARINKKKTG